MTREQHIIDAALKYAEAHERVWMLMRKRLHCEVAQSPDMTCGDYGVAECKYSSNEDVSEWCDHCQQNHANRSLYGRALADRRRALARIRYHAKRVEVGA